MRLLMTPSMKMTIML
ncbi:unnamed protein product [Acanthoscelides obtectus]|uniref:Uncharacterized protein n=1 Tax=Acanthoscelides obtectus TaxID=200917 RepID=A0A9P0MHQ1_ACAOB|nr:unnamed protein product [Acanthoscelides obtectus]CAK1651354.1 hypothetical protein AOBTE_LOCUS17214 [Acanthoscelides obtectus]